MLRVVKQIEIDVAREHVFAHVADVQNMPQWTTFVREIEITSGEGKSRGTTDRSVFKVGPKAKTVDAECTEYEQGVAFGRKFTSGVDWDERMTFAASNGGTVVEWAVEYTPPMGLLGEFVDLVFMGRLVQNELEASLENLKAALES
jgi:uncharacterized membrane protein